MHELPITQRLLEMVLEVARQHRARRVRVVHLVIGEMTGYVDEAVQFYFDILSRGTLAEGARLRIHREPGQARCLSCGHTFPVAPPLPLGCPQCKSPRLEITGGDACRLEAVELDDIP